MISASIFLAEEFCTNSPYPFPPVRRGNNEEVWVTGQSNTPLPYYMGLGGCLSRGYPLLPP